MHFLSHLKHKTTAIGGKYPLHQHFVIRYVKITQITRVLA